VDIRSLKLYHDGGSRSSRVRWLLLEIGEQSRFEVERVSLRDGEQYGAQFSQINPNRAVPVLEVTWVNDQKLDMIESAAMVTFLADAFPRSGLAPLPDAGHLRADYLQMVHFGSTTMDMALWQLRLHERLLTEGDRHPRTAARNRKTFGENVEPYLEVRLTHNRHICGSEFSAADCVIGHNVLWARRHGLCQSNVFTRYLKALAARPACMEAFDDAPHLRDELLRSSS
jgi:glutathione S-transferase